MRGAEDTAENKTDIVSAFGNPPGYGGWGGGGGGRSGWGPGGWEMTIAMGPAERRAHCALGKCVGLGDWPLSEEGGGEEQGGGARPLSATAG